MAQEFVLGEEDLANLEGIEELSDEDEALLLKELDNVEVDSETSKDTQRITV
jgi:large subunit ribosomal protein L28